MVQATPNEHQTLRHPLHRRPPANATGEPPANCPSALRALSDLGPRVITAFLLGLSLVLSSVATLYTAVFFLNSAQELSPTAFRSLPPHVNTPATFAVGTTFRRCTLPEADRR